MGERRRFLLVICALLLVIVVGIIGYMVIEKWSFLDAIYMTVITISTVGYAEVYDLSAGGKIFSVVLIIGGVGVMLYALGIIVQYLVEGNLRNIFWRRRMEKKISKLKRHFIVCGYGRVGQAVAQTFRNEGTAFVVIDPEPETITRAAADNYLYLQGDATDDEVLRSAGIHQARGLVAATGNDASNMYIILSARELAPELLIIARACAEESKSKLERAGANRVINPYYFGGQRMARLALHPLVIEFIETALHRHGQELVLEGIEFMPVSLLVGKSIGEAQLYSGGASILAIKKSSGDILSKPADETLIEPGDKLVILGTREQLQLLEGTA